MLFNYDVWVGRFSKQSRNSPETESIPVDPAVFTRQIRYSPSFRAYIIAKNGRISIGHGMIFLFLLFVSSVGLACWSVVAFGPILTIPFLIGATGFVLTTILFFRTKLLKRPNWVVVDGSNVLYWADETPALASVRMVVEKLVLDGFEPLLWFDANVGYLVAGRYMSPDHLAKALGYPARRISVAPKGTPADPLLIRDAERLKARIVTNDRFRDWRESHPLVERQEVFLRGRIEKRQVHLG
ncbi:hypothetical protein ACFORG_12735 [Lutimaribacter marinistellae]|uniref:RNase NYN domain-containing protein n=1 Tax=Lutimaribacter marinistellae TaxID=1820329 RepID=A0ABV7TGA0_9RHOB